MGFLIQGVARPTILHSCFSMSFFLEMSEELEIPGNHQPFVMTGVGSALFYLYLVLAHIQTCLKVQLNIGFSRRL